MSENIRPRWDVSRVSADTLDLLGDEERRCLELSTLQCSILRQMTFPWAKFRTRLVEEHPDYWVLVEQPQAYIDALEELEILLSGAYDGPKEGCVSGGEVFVDRGDVGTFDFTIVNFTANGGWQVKDLSGIITDADATRVLINVEIRDGSANQAILLTDHADTHHYNRAGAHTHVANVYSDLNCEVSLSGGRSMDYLISSGMDICSMTIRGWWRPAA